MEDRYLFRGKCKDTCEWFYGHYAFIENTHCVLENAPSTIPTVASFFKFEVIPETVGQCTGLKDKNGKLIFEDDIVIWDDSSNKDGTSVRTAKVCINPDIYFEILPQSKTCRSGKQFHYGNFIYTDTENHLEIIGNIHEV